MKKYSIIFVSILLLFNSCKKDDDFVFNQSPDERIKEALASFEQTLLSAENGWKAFVRVDSGRGGTYSMYFKFNDQNRVVMVSDFDSVSAKTPKESSYRLKAQQQPTLIFDTYSYIHVLADPNESVAIGLNGSLNVNVNGGNVGEGLFADFEYIIDKSQINGDTVKMNGKVNGTKLVLVKASKAESDIYLGGQFDLASRFFTKEILTYFERLTIGSQLYDITFDVLNRLIIFRWVDGSGNPQVYATGYYNVIGGIGLQDPLVNGSQTISAFTGLSWNAGTQTATIKVGTQTATVTPIVVPLYVDKQAPNRWWQTAYNFDAYWYSWDGFHINGQDDALGLNTMQNYYYYLYWPGVAANNDAAAPIFVNAAGTSLEFRFAAAPRKPTVTADGRAIFSLLGLYGPPNFQTHPTTGPGANTLVQLLIPQGYYFVQVAQDEYDMVSAANGLAWIRWQLIQ